MIKKVLNIFNKSDKKPEILLKSNIEVDKAEYERIYKEHAIEREWYADTPFFQSAKSIQSAHKKGKLSRVVSSDDYQLIMRLRNPELESKYPPFLTPEALNLLNDITKQWRKAMNKAKKDKRIVLAVTSLARDKDYQMEIVASGKLAISDGPHLRGEAFDIDGCGYYFEGKPVNPRQAKKGDEFHNAFKEMGAELKKPDVLDYSSYDPEVHSILKTVLDEMQRAGRLHYLLEFPNSSNTAFHVARNPNYEN